MASVGHTCRSLQENDFSREPGNSPLTPPLNFASYRASGPRHVRKYGEIRIIFARPAIGLPHSVQPHCP
jgi:hypothetical protein